MYLYNRTYNRYFVDQSINFEFKIRPDYMEIQKAYRRKNPFSEKQNLNIVEKIGKNPFLFKFAMHISLILVYLKNNE